MAVFGSVPALCARSSVHNAVICPQVEARFLLEPSEEKRGLGAASGAAGVSEVNARCSASIPIHTLVLRLSCSPWSNEFS